MEKHPKSSDWYAHHHENDSNYDKVILHVVWEGDISIFRKDGTQIPTLETSASRYWDNHYTFGKTSRQSKKKITKDFLDLLVINTLVPLKFCYAKHVGEDWSECLFSLISQIKSGNNAIIKNFKSLGSKTKNALESRAKIQLHTNHCSKNKCLQCNLGVHLLNRNT